MKLHIMRNNKYRLIVLVTAFLYSTVINAFNYAEIKSGDTYESVKSFLFQRGDKVLAFTDQSLTTEYGPNTSIETEFIFKEKRLCKVHTKYGQRELKWVLNDIDQNSRKYGTPTEIQPRGNSPGDGFKITWKNNKQLLIYSIGNIPLVNNEKTKVESINTDGNVCEI